MLYNRKIHLILLKKDNRYINNSINDFENY